jgi:hypothetical protein
MHNAFRTIRTLAIPLLLGISLSACALGRSEIMVAPPASSATADTNAPVVKIVNVRDLRQFSTNPRDPSEPSLGEAAEVNDPKLTARMVGRKRGGYGNAMGDVALAEGTTVSTLITGAAQTALQNKGYRVVGENSPDYGRALPLTLDIEQYWSWVADTFIAPKVNAKARIVMKGDPVGSSPAIAEAQVTSADLPTDAVWTRTNQTNVNELIAKMSEKIRPASELRR